MTNRDFLNAIINSNLSDELKAFASGSLAKLDNQNEKRRNTMSKEQIANEEIKTHIVEVLDTPKVASAIASALDISTQKASALCKQLVDEGKIKVADIKVKNKGTLKEYFRTT